MDAQSTAHSDLLALRLKYLKNGYFPMPLAGKRPWFEGWTTGAIDEARLRQLHKEHPRDTNTGLRCDGIVFVDIDVRDKDVVRAIVTAMVKHLGTPRGLRTGKAPKTGALYRMDGPYIGKRFSNEYVLNGEKAQLEIFNGPGCQFVVNGIHPETHQPYRWSGATPEDVRLCDQPAITADQIGPFLAECESIIEAAGGGLTKKGSAGGEGCKRSSRNAAIWAAAHEAGIVQQLLERMDLRSILEEHNYEPDGGRYRAPGSDGAPAIRIMVGTDGVERLCSDHATDRLCRFADHGFGSALSAIDVVAILEHGGDLAKAIDALCFDYGIEYSACGEFDALPIESSNGALANVGPMLDRNHPMQSAQVFVKTCFAEADCRTLHHQKAEFFSWTGTHYQRGETAEVRALVYAYLNSARHQTKDGSEPFKPTRNRVSDFLDALAAAVQLPCVVRAPTWLKDDASRPPASEVIPCANGLLHLPTRALLTHTPEFFAVNALE